MLGAGFTTARDRERCASLLLASYGVVFAVGAADCRMPFLGCGERELTASLVDVMVLDAIMKELTPSILTPSILTPSIVSLGLSRRTIILERAVHHEGHEETRRNTKIINVPLKPAAVIGFTRTVTARSSIAH